MAKHTDPSQLLFNFDDTYVEEIKKSNNTKPQNVLPIGTEVIFHDPVFNKEEQGKIIAWNGNQIQTQIGRRIFHIGESDILEIVKQNEQVAQNIATASHAADIANGSTIKAVNVNTKMHKSAKVKMYKSAKIVS